MVSFTSTTAIIALGASFSIVPSHALSLRLHSSQFLGNNVNSFSQEGERSRNRMIITMRKQKASNKRTTRLQRGNDDNSQVSTMDSLSSLATPTSTSSWNYKSVSPALLKNASNMNDKGRGRSRKRSQYYSSLSAYHTHFLNLITAEFLAEVSLENLIEEYT